MDVVTQEIIRRAAAVGFAADYVPNIESRRQWAQKVPAIGAGIFYVPSFELRSDRLFGRCVLFAYLAGYRHPLQDAVGFVLLSNRVLVANGYTFVEYTYEFNLKEGEV